MYNNKAKKRVILSQFSTASAAEDDIAPSFLETIYGVNVIGAIRKLFSHWFSLKWEENGVFWRLRCWLSSSFPSLLCFTSILSFSSFAKWTKMGSKIRKFFIFLDLQTAILAREAKKLMVSYLLWFLKFYVQTFIRLTAKSWTQQNCQHFTGHFWNRFCL